MKKPLWYPSADLDAQLAHAGWGAFVAAACMLHHLPWWHAPAALAVYVAPKEFVFDIFIECDGVLNGVKDAAAWYAGWGFAHLVNRLWPYMAMFLGRLWRTL